MDKRGYQNSLTIDMIQVLQVVSQLIMRQAMAYSEIKQYDAFSAPFVADVHHLIKLRLDELGLRSAGNSMELLLLSMIHETVQQGSKIEARCFLPLMNCLTEQDLEVKPQTVEDQLKHPFGE